jgi:predicted nuclease of predicted toxin-antitoxin system
VSLHFLADESCDFGVVRLLRNTGYEVTAIAEILPRADDKKVIKIALEKKSVLITEDKDFGQLVYANGYGSVGVLLLRYPASARKRLLKDIVSFIQQQHGKLAGCFAVLQPGRVRIGRIPVSKKPE